MLILKELTELNGVSGNEDAVRNYIREQIYSYADDVKVDTLGNLIAFKKGKSSSVNIMLAAHMDEVGFIVTGYNDMGMLKFQNVGGIDERILPGKVVLVGDKKIPGVIGAKAIHLQDSEERKASWKMKNMYIDIGAANKEEAEKLAPLGEYISFYSEFTEYGQDCIKAKALDDRVGCGVLMEVLKGNYEFNLYACFTVQEEIGLRGAETAAYRIKPDMAIIFEGTTCSNVPETEEHAYSTKMGEGPALTLMDGGTYADKNFVNYIYSLAKRKNIDVQFKQTATGGNDGAKIQRTGKGAKVAIISVPCRYIHSPSSIMNKKDYEGCKKLASCILNDLSNNLHFINNILKGDEVNV
ncbi:MAG: M42 family metallopeptidase [Firmicutes bacterium]|nr:M42 family metallopeptidase [Bacillota bacterium]